MFRFIVRRLIWAVPTLLIVTFLVYVAIRIGTDPVASYLRSNARASAGGRRAVHRATTACTRASAATSGATSRGSAGSSPATGRTSIKGNQPVWPNLKDAMANSLRLAGIAAIIGIIVGCTFGVFAAAEAGLAARRRASTPRRW